MFSTKETALISVVALTVGLGFVLVWTPATEDSMLLNWGGRARLCLLALASAALFLTVPSCSFHPFSATTHRESAMPITTYLTGATGMVEHTAAW